MFSVLGGAGLFSHRPHHFSQVQRQNELLMQSGVGVAQPLLQREVFSHLLCLQRSGGKMPLVVPPFFWLQQILRCVRMFHSDSVQKISQR